MAYINTERGRLHYRPINLYLGIKQIDRTVAFENLEVLLDMLSKNGVTVSPALGTLLGIVRENDFIEWDEDIDLFVLEEDKKKLLNSFWDLHEAGFEVVREERAGLLYSVARNGEYIDFYIMEKLSPEVRGSADVFMLERHLTELVDWNFKGVTIKVPKDYEEFLTLRYGDWRTPVQYANFEMSKYRIAKLKAINVVKSLIPRFVKRKMLKTYHQKDLMKFIDRCDAMGIALKYPIRYGSIEITPPICILIYSNKHCEGGNVLPKAA